MSVAAYSTFNPTTGQMGMGAINVSLSLILSFSLVLSPCGSEKELKVEVARQREMKWLDMFNNWDKWVNRRFQKVCHSLSLSSCML